MNNMSHNFFQSQALAEDRPVNLSRRSFLGASLGALILGVALPDSGVRAQGAAAAAVKPGTRVSAFLEIHADSTVLLRSPFIEGGQGIFTGMAQIVGEEAVDRNVAPLMAAEDFSYMLAHRPGAYIFMGNGDGAGLHHPDYDFNDAAAPYGASLWARLIETRLPVSG